MDFSKYHLMPVAGSSHQVGCYCFQSLPFSIILALEIALLRDHVGTVVVMDEILIFGKDRMITVTTSEP